MAVPVLHVRRCAPQAWRATGVVCRPPGHKWDNRLPATRALVMMRGMAGLGGRRRRRNWQLIGGVCALVVVVSTVWAARQIGRGGLEPADTAGVLGLVLSVLGLVVAVVALRRPVEGNDAELARGWAKTLAGQVETGESRIWRQLLGDDTRRINLAYTLHPGAARPAVAPAAGRLTADGAGPVALPDIVTYYRSTRPLRLLVTGAAGAGKTVLALELMLALLDGRAADDPVPVRIPLSLWDTERHSLPELLQQRLVEAYDWPVDLAAGLVRHGLVLPILDGLDEMDPPGPDGTPDPAAPRATGVVRALNAYQQGRGAGPLILTCRTRHYDALAPHIQLLDAARIAIAPVGADDARAYLTDRALDAARWQPLLDHLVAHPGGALASVLSTPWRLCLTATVYQYDGDPAELLALPDADALDEHLLARYIPAATRTAPNPHRYTAQEVHRWLRHLTTHLEPVGTSQRAEATDIVLHELWPLGGPLRVRLTEFALCVLPIAFIWNTPRIPVGAAVVSFAGLLLLGRSAAAPPRSLEGKRLSTPQGLRSLLFALVFGLMVGAAAGVAVGRVTGLTLGVTAGLVAGLMGRALGEPRGATTPRATIRGDAVVGLAFGGVVALACALLADIPIGLTLGLIVGLFLATAATRYVAFLLCSWRRLPFRLARFLDWAVAAGLMRYSGSAYQYRHRELQHWLGRHPQPRSDA